MVNEKIVYVVIPPEEEKCLTLAGMEYFNLRAIAKKLPEYSIVISADCLLQTCMERALEIEPTTYVKIIGDTRVDEIQALNFFETLEDKTLLISGRPFLKALGFREIGEETMLVKILIGDPLNNIKEIA